MRNGIYDVLQSKTDRSVDRYHVPLPSGDTGHLPNLLFIKDAIIKRSATSIVLSEYR
jgi:hypothetical protein